MKRAATSSLVLALLLTGCGSHHSAATAPATTRAATTVTGPGALLAEPAAEATGPIPRKQVFILFRNPIAGFMIETPQGWSEAGLSRSIVFRNDNNIVRIVVAKAARPSAAALEQELRGAGPASSGPEQRVSLPAGAAFKAVYRTTGPPNPETGKRVTLTVDRYTLWRRGRQATIDLASPVGVDNARAYRLIARSFRWR